ncbi:MAG: OmpA family protein [Lentimicrobium sp.]|nr:OmpA family protein [Lentimicrobium sp.]
MKTKYLVLLFVAVFATGYQGFAQRAKADRLFTAFNYSRAIPYYEKLAAKNNKHFAHATERLGDCNRLTGNFEDAARWYNKALEVNKTNPDLYYHYGQSLRSLGKYEEAAEQFSKYSSLKPDDPKGKLFEKYSREVNKWTEPEYDYELINAEAINTPFSDFSPVYGKDGVIFTSDRMARAGAKRYGWTGAYFLDLFYATLKKEEDKNFPVPGSPSLYSASLSQPYHDGPATFSKDFLTVYFTRVTRKTGELDSTRYYTNRLKMYSSKFEDGKWGDPEPFYLNSELYSVGHPALSSDGKTLYFVSDMPGGQGGTDIYRVKLLDTGWGPAENLGEIINTFGDEMFPYFHKDSILYFSSTGHPGLGSLDVFKSLKTEDGWTTPHNLKAPLNSPADDFGIVIHSNEAEGMISSNRPGGVGEDDIYLITISERLPDSVLISGFVKDKTTLELMKNVTVFVLDQNTNEITVLKTDDSGQYAIQVKRGSQLLVKAIKNGFYPDCLALSLDMKSRSTEVKNRDLLLGKYKLDQIFALENIYYDFDKSNIRPDAAVELDKVAIFLNENPQITVELGSHTDSRGSFSYNDRLSERRAASAVEYIKSRGINKDRITSKGYGEYKLVNQCSDNVQCSEVEHQKNRRTEIKISGLAESEKQGTEEPLDDFKASQKLELKDLNEDFFKNCSDSESSNYLPIYSKSPLKP